MFVLRKQLGNWQQQKRLNDLVRGAHSNIGMLLCDHDTGCRETRGRIWIFSFDMGCNSEVVALREVAASFARRYNKTWD